jgi:hypothetical protein
MDSFTLEAPEIILPSIGMVSPGFTIKILPGVIVSIGTLT